MNSKILSLFGGVAVMLFVVAICIWTSLAKDLRLARNSEILARWEKDRENILHLKDLMAQQPVEIIGIGKQGVMYREPWRQISPEEAGMPMGKFIEFKKLMKTSGIASLIRKEQEFDFIFDGWGFAGRGHRMAFIYNEKVPTNVVSNLDNYIKPPNAQSSIFVFLEENWYFRLVW